MSDNNTMTTRDRIIDEALLILDRQIAKFYRVYKK